VTSVTCLIVQFSKVALERRAEEEAAGKLPDDI
jgi:hypothetical protein